VDGGTTSCRVDQLLAVLYRLLFVSLTYTHYALANQNLRGGGLVGGLLAVGVLGGSGPNRYSLTSLCRVRKMKRPASRHSAA